MAESVQTGGMMSFRHPRRSEFKLDEGEKREIERAYEAADERKRKQKRNRWVLILIIVLLVVVLGIWLALK